MKVTRHSLVGMSKPVEIRVQLPPSTESAEAELTFSGEECVVRLPEWKFIEKPQQLDIKKSKGGGISIGVGNRRGMVADYLPRALWLTIDETPATLLDAKMQIEERAGWFEGMRQRYTGSRLLYGAHLDSDQEPVGTIRFALNAKIHSSWSTQNEARFTTGTVRPWAREDDLLGIEVSLDEPLGLSEFERRTLAPLHALFSLWTHRNFTVGHVEFESPAHGWLTARDFHPLEPPKMTQSKLLPLFELSTDTLARWLDVASRLGPIAEMVLHHTGTIQVDALVTAAAFEGCHRRLVRDLTKKVDYRIRVEELAEKVEDLIPGLLGPDRHEWAIAVKVIRNEQGHVFANIDNFDDTHISRYYVHHHGAEWVLRLFLLLQVVDRDVLSKQLKDCDKFWFTLANIDREQFWPDFSAYETFRQHVLHKTVY